MAEPLVYMYILNSIGQWLDPSKDIPESAVIEKNTEKGVEGTVSGDVHCIALLQRPGQELVLMWEQFRIYIVFFGELRQIIAGYSCSGLYEVGVVMSS
jgi:hypothetical protein